MLNKKVKGEGLKTLFIYVRVGKGKKGKIKKYPRVKNRKSPKKNIKKRFKIYPSPFTSSPNTSSKSSLSKIFSYPSEIFCYLSEIISYLSELSFYPSEIFSE